MPGFRTPWEALGGEDEKLEGQTERVQPRVEGQESSRLCQKWLPLTSEFTAEQYLLGLFLKLCCFGLLQLNSYNYPPHPTTGRKFLEFGLWKARGCSPKTK